MTKEQRIGVIAFVILLPVALLVIWLGRVPNSANAGTVSGTSLTGNCEASARIPGEPDALGYTLTLTDNGDQTDIINGVGIVFYNEQGEEIGSDNPATVDTGQAYPIQGGMNLLITSGQSVTLNMETQQVSNVYFTCELATWSDN